jgi:hypothetical protein
MSSSVVPAVTSHDARIEAVELRSFRDAELVQVVTVPPDDTCRLCDLHLPTSSAFYLHQITLHRALLFPTRTDLDRFVLIVSLAFANQSVNIRFVIAFVEGRMITCIAASPFVVVACPIDFFDLVFHCLYCIFPIEFIRSMLRHCVNGMAVQAIYHTTTRRTEEK